MSTPEGPGLDLQELARLANELFRQAPGAQPAALGQPAPSVSGVSGPTRVESVEGAVGIPKSSSVPRTAPGGAAASPSPGQEFPIPGAEIPPLYLAGAPSPQLPASPGAASPNFYFLEHARGLAVAPASASPRLDSWLSDPWSAAAAVPSQRADAAAAVPKAPGFDLARVRSDFPILGERVNGRPLIWLDNAATTQKPRAVIERLSYFYEHENSNIHRAAHELAARATDAYEAARETARRFLNAASAQEIVFVRGATEGINLVAQAWGRANVGPGDEIVVSHLEHHANIVPWQQLTQETGAKLRVAPVDDQGQILLEEYGKLLGPRTKLVSITQVSNALGTVTPVAAMVRMAQAVGARVLVDGAQAVSHMPVDVQALGADFYVFSGHKVFGPTGIGVVHGRPDALEEMPPWQGGGNMIQDVTFERTVYQGPPQRFEAGTGNIADAVGLGAALDYVMRLGMPLLAAYEHELLVYGTRLLERIPGLRMIGTAPEKAGVLSFVVEGFRTDDISHQLNEYGIAVRGGHHCAQPILRRFGLESTVRPSLAFYNTCAELDALAEAVTRIVGPQGKSASVPSFRSGLV